jgi:hypothetical protein
MRPGLPVLGERIGIGDRENLDGLGNAARDVAVWQGRQEDLVADHMVGMIEMAVCRAPTRYSVAVSRTVSKPVVLMSDPLRPRPAAKRSFASGRVARSSRPTLRPRPGGVEGSGLDLAFGDPGALSRQPAAKVTLVLARTDDVEDPGGRQVDAVASGDHEREALRRVLADGIGIDRLRPSNGRRRRPAAWRSRFRPAPRCGGIRGLVRARVRTSTGHRIRPLRRKPGFDPPWGRQPCLSRGGASA